MVRHSLLISQQNEVLKVLQQVGLEPANFSWVIGEYRTPSKEILTRGLTEVVHTCPKLKYQNSPFYFQFELPDGRHCCLFSPGSETPVEHQCPSSWDRQRECVRLWARCLKREIEAPDLWQEMHKYQASVSLAIPEQLLNEPIPVYEAEQVADKLHQLADKIEELFQLTAAQNQFVRSKLNYLAEAAKRQRSADWVHTSIGVFVAIAMGLSLEPDRAKELWQLIENIVGPFIHLLGS
jgi:hypothetical protein